MTDDFVPADWQTRSLAFLIDLIIYVAIFYSLGGPGHFISTLYIVFRDGLFNGQSIGKKAMGIQVLHTDGRGISFVDSSFRNVLFIFYLLLPLAIAIEGVAVFRSAERLRLGDRLAKTRVVRKSAIPVLA